MLITWVKKIQKFKEKLEKIVVIHINNTTNK